MNVGPASISCFKYSPTAHNKNRESLCGTSDPLYSIEICYWRLTFTNVEERTVSIVQFKQGNVSKV